MKPLRGTGFPAAFSIDINALTGNSWFSCQGYRASKGWTREQMRDVFRHCEHSEAIQCTRMDCFTAFAMTENASGHLEFSIGIASVNMIKNNA
jgi:hypothetical protein